MSYSNRQLQRDESIVIKSRPTLVRVIIGIIWFPPIIAFFTRLIRRATTELTLTTNRVIGKTGIINTRSLDSKLDKVQSVSVENGFWGKIFGYGTVCVTTAGSIVYFKDISKAEKFKQAVLRQQDLYEEEKARKQAQLMASAMVK